MTAISYSIALGQPLEQVTPGANAPAAGTLEIRFDQTATTVTDAQSPTGTRMPKKGEIYTLLKILEEKLINDSTVFE
jgi:hypothetical protein